MTFHAAKPGIAKVALAASARAFEPPQWCPQIAERYYAAFEHLSGNRLEVVRRYSIIARLKRQAKRTASQLASL